MTAGVADTRRSASIGSRGGPARARARTGRSGRPAARGPGRRRRAPNSGCRARRGGAGRARSPRGLHRSLPSDRRLGRASRAVPIGRPIEIGVRPGAHEAVVGPAASARRRDRADRRRPSPRQRPPVFRHGSSSPKPRPRKFHMIRNVARLIDSPRTRIGPRYPITLLRSTSSRFSRGGVPSAPPAPAHPASIRVEAIPGGVPPVGGSCSGLVGRERKWSSILGDGSRLIRNDRRISSKCIKDRFIS